jgi:hypothetical protein
MNVQTSLITISESHATLQQERVKAIMAETGMNFAEACNQYIRERQGRLVLQPMPIVPVGNV